MLDSNPAQKKSPLPSMQDSNPAQRKKNRTADYLEGHEEGDGLDGVVSSVDVVAHEEVIRVWRFATNPETNKKDYRGGLKDGID